MPFAKNVYVLIPRGYYAQCNKSDGKTNTLLSFICEVKNNKINVYNKTQTNSQIQRTNYWLLVRRGNGEGQNRGTRLRDTNYCI